MKKIVIMPGGFHPFHAGHAALYQSAVKAFPDAEVYVAASNDTSERPFPFAIKEKLAKVAGIPPGRFVQVKSPFTSEEITSKYDPNSTVLIFVKSEKNSKNGSDPEGPFPAEVDPTTGKLPLVSRGPRKGQPVSDRLQYYKGNEKNLQPMSRHSYLAYLPTVEFGPGIKSGSELRNAWPKLDDRRKTAFVMSMYPATQKNEKLAANVVKMIDMGMGGQQGVAEAELDEAKAKKTEEDIFLKGKKVGSITTTTTKGGITFYTAQVGNSFVAGSDTREEALKHLKRLYRDYYKKQGVAEGRATYGPITANHKAASKKAFAAGERDGKAGAEKNKEYMSSALMKTTYLNGYKQGKQGVAEGYNDLGPEYGGAYVNGRSDDARMTARLTRQAKAAAAKAGKTFGTSEEYRKWHRRQKEKQGVAEGASNDMSTEDMIAYLRQHHDKNLHQDYLNHITSTNSKFVLKNIPLTSIRTELSGLDRAKVEQYKQMDFSKAPPIVVGSDGNILDGYHRATVAKALGIPTIKAYVGVKGQQGVAEGSKVKTAKGYGDVVQGTDVKTIAKADLSKNKLNLPQGYGDVVQPQKLKTIAKAKGVAEGSEEKDNLIWTLNSFGYYSDNSSVYVNDDGDKIVRVGSEWKHQSGKRGRGPEELGNFLSSNQGVAEEIGGVGGGFGTNYPGTYEQENGPFTHKGGLKLTSLTTESVDYLDEK